MQDSGYLKDNEELIQKLRGIPTLKIFKDEDLRGVLELSRMIRYEPGSLIIREGQYDNWVYFLIFGKVGILKQGETIGVLKGKGDIFGEMGILDGSPRSASIMAIDETVCLAIDLSYADRLPEGDRVAFNCILYHVFAQILANRLRIADEELVRIKDENAVLRAELKRMREGENG
jgi:CRP-like cAMP-binding protein